MFGAWGSSQEATPKFCGGYPKPCRQAPGTMFKLIQIMKIDIIYNVIICRSMSDACVQGKCVVEPPCHLPGSFAESARKSAMRLIATLVHLPNLKSAGLPQVPAPVCLCASCLYMCSMHAHVCIYHILCQCVVHFFYHMHA